MFTKKIVAQILLSFLLINTHTIPVPTNHNTLANNETQTITPYNEETEWHYQLVDGNWQKRLWSITYNKWLTDWMWV